MFRWSVQMIATALASLATAHAETHAGVFRYGGGMSDFETCHNDEHWRFSPNADLGEAFWNDVEKIETDFRKEFGYGSDVFPMLFVEAEGVVGDPSRRLRKRGYDFDFAVSAYSLLRVASVDEVRACVNAAIIYR